MRVLIDAGHGIDTPGKRSPDGSFLEYLWNRQVADLVIARLKAAGVDCGLVVTETNDISLRTRAARVKTSVKVRFIQMHSIDIAKITKKQTSQFRKTHF